MFNWAIYFSCYEIEVFGLINLYACGNSLLADEKNSEKLPAFTICNPGTFPKLNFIIYKLDNKGVNKMTMDLSMDYCLHCE